MDCPQCGQGQLEMVSHPQSGASWIRCSAYPRCRFEAADWEAVAVAAARFHHRVVRGHHS